MYLVNVYVKHKKAMQHSDFQLSHNVAAVTLDKWKCDI